MDNLDDKLINVIVKYVVQGDDKAQTSSKKTKENFMRDMNEMLTAFQKLRTEGIRTWDDLAKNLDKLDLSKVSEEFKQPFLEAASTIANYEALYQQANPGKSGGPLDPQTPRKFGAEIQTVEQGLQKLKSTARDMGEVGSFLAISGGLITGPALLNASNYVKTLGEITPLTAEWLTYQRSVEQSNLRIGETTTQALLPAYRMTAEFMEKVAGVVQQNPWLVQAAVYAGGAMVAIGGTMRVVSEITKVVAEIGLLLARLELNQAKATANQFGGYGGGEYLPGGAGSAAGSALGAIGTVTLIATSVIIGAELGEALGNYLGKTIYGDSYQEQNVGDALVTLMRIFQLPWALLASLLEKIDPSLKGVAQGLMDVLNNIQGFVGKLTGASEYKNKEAESSPLLEQNEMITQQMVEAYISFQKQINAAQENYSAQRKEIIEQYESQIADSTARYQSQRADIINSYNEQSRRASENFARSQAQALEAYERQRAEIISSAQEAEAKAVSAYQTSSQRAAQAHRLELQRMEQDHNSRMWEAAANRDALALVKESESYNTERSRKEEDFRIQEAQRREDFQRQIAEIRANAQQQLAELKANHERQRAEQRAEFERQQAEAQAQLQKNLARLDESHKRELEKLAQQEKEKLKKLDEGYKKQVDQIQTAFIDRLRSLDAAILGDTQAFTRYMQEQAIQFQNWLNQFKAQANSQLPSATSSNSNAIGIQVNRGRQYGGYASFMGPGETGENEFVMSHETTKMAEALVGARLNQANLIQGIMAGKNISGGSASRSVQIIVQSRNLTLSEIRAQVDQVFNQRLSDLLPAFGV